MTHNIFSLTFIELPFFSKAREIYLSDDAFRELQQTLISAPETGDIIPGTGGARKLRWSRPGMGKRGGLRVIYYYVDVIGQIWLLTLYSKNVADNIQPQILKRLTESIHAEINRKNH
ncbi:transcriptional regulator [Candidatus Methylospira mobilis]|uniref:transcriptional regulator n=1 Tax=Candidatus Methylospira mobilis TaxID=1808979 RepID=UPI0028E2B338|nr:transcriptional regulator [Candidatus Methylospira mobilis]WNV05443.1 transcriptional regulator [Candidatus Methylospira mobilis]